MTDRDEVERRKARMELDRALNTPTLALREIRQLKERLAEVERERDDLQRMINGKTFAIEVSGSAEFEQMKQERDEARALAAVRTEEAARRCKDRAEEVVSKHLPVSAYNELRAMDAAIRALARPEETDALDRIRAEVWREALRIVAEWEETYNAEDDEKGAWVAGIIFKDLRNAVIREDKT